MGKFNELELPNPIKNSDEKWDQHLGMEVEDFITRKLESSNIIGMEYDKSSYKLSLIKENGDVLEQEVSVIDPTYSYGIKVMGLKIEEGNNTNIYTDVESLTFLYKSGKTIRLGIAMYALITTSDTKDRTGLFNVKVNYGNKNITLKATALPYSRFTIKDGEIQDVNISSYDELSWIDITSLFTEYTSALNIKATVIPGVKEGAEQVSDTLKFSVTTEVIKIMYSGSTIVNGNTIDFTVSGGTSGNYVLGGYFNSTNWEKLTTLQFNNLKSGLNKLIVQAVNVNDSSITSDYLYLDIINTKECTTTEVAINNVNDYINNNGVSELYNLTVFSPNLELISITTYLEDTQPLGDNLTNVVKTEVLSASSYNENNSKVTSYSKYIEIISSNALKYLAVSINGIPYKFKTVTKSPVTGLESIYERNFKTIQIEPIDQELTYYSGYNTNYNFDQMTGYLNNVFKTSLYSNTPNIVDDIDVSDGWQEKDGITYFKVSARDSSIFKNPLPLNLLGSSTIELGFKTYNISDENKSILTFGNFQLRPTLLCWNDGSITDEINDATFTARNSQFLENVNIHLLMTIHENYFIDKNDIYYPQYLKGDFQNNFDNSSKDTKWHLVRIFINGVIDREIEISTDELNILKNSSLDIKPTTCDVDFYLVRVYNSQALNFYLVKRNYTSFLTNRADKLKFYNANNITFTQEESEISFANTLGKYNSLVYVYPKGARFPNRAWGGADNDSTVEDLNKPYPVTLFINYADELTNLKYGGRIINGLVKGQGSSAMRYLIWNVNYSLNKFKDSNKEKIKSLFLPYSAMDPETNTFNADAASSANAMNGYYKMPNYSGQEDAELPKITKLVGKVNFASSMQSHKIGACKLYDDAFKYTFKTEYQNMMYSGGKKAVHEEPYLYFYWETDMDDVNNIQLADILANNDQIKFMGFQTWGAGKGDKAESGYDEDATPGYLMLEGGENDEATTNFRVPWQDLQRASGGEIGSTDYKLLNYPTLNYSESELYPWKNLMIDDESIVHVKRGAWDIDFGCNDDKNAFAIDGNLELQESIKLFRKFYDFVYTHDYNVIVSNATNSDEWLKLGNPEFIKEHKIVTTNTNLLVNGARPNNPAIGDVYRYDYVNEKWVPAGTRYTNGSWNKLNIYTQSGVDNSLPVEAAILSLKDLFTHGIKEFIDENDIAFHQAFIKFISGTDNRAKNTYFLIIGPKYEENPITGKFEKTEIGDRKIRLIGDDLDTIFLTDNSGLQSKTYNILEPSYDIQYDSKWGDSNNIFFYMFDQCFEEKIKEFLKSIIEKAFDKTGEVENKDNYFYKVFFDVLENFPAVAYNHTAKIYYETAKALLESNAFGGIYKNNDLEPIEQSHGSCLSCEKQFMNKRMNFLTGYAQTRMKGEMSTAASGNEAMPITLRMKFEPYQDFYPNYRANVGVYKYTGNFNNSEYMTNRYLAKANNGIYEVEILDSAINLAIAQMHLYKSLDILGLTLSGISENFERITDFKIDNAELANYEMFNGRPELSLSNFSASFPVLERLVLRNMKLPNTMNLSNYLKLREADFTGTTVKQVTLPQSKKLSKITLPNSIEDFRIYNNPGLEEVNFEGTNNIKNVYIDCDKCGNFNVSEFIENLNSAESLTLVNCNLNISEAAVLRIVGVSNCNITGTINIITGTEPTAISFDTKLALVNKFGNIESGKLRINYASRPIIQSEITFNEIVNVFRPSAVEGDYVEPNPFGLTIKLGNNIGITSDGKPNIIYELSGISSSVAVIDKYSGDITLKQESTSPGSVKITITFTDGGKWSNINKPITVNFKWQAPQIGDIAYADGSFSKSYTTSKTAVGIVYAIDSEEQDNNGDSIKGTAHIIGVDMAALDLYLGYHYDSSDSNYKGTDQRSITLKAMYDQVESSSGFGIVNYSDVDTNSSTYIGNITVDDTSILTKSPSEYKGKEDTAIIVKHVSKLLDKLRSVFGNNFSKNYLEYDLEGNTIIKDSGSLDIIASTLASTYSSFEEYASSLLYPYYYKMYLYQPYADNLDPQYARHNWYAPSAEELSRVIYYRGYSAKGNNFTEYNEARADISTKNIESVGDKVAIYCNKNANLIKNCSIFVLDRTTSGSRINSATTSSATDGQFRSYEEVRYYESGVAQESAEWVFGHPKPYLYNNSPSTNQPWCKEASTTAWKLAKHSGVPFVQYKYEKPV